MKDVKMIYSAEELKKTKGIGVALARLLEISKANYAKISTPTDDVIDVIADWTCITDNNAGFGKNTG